MNRDPLNLTRDPRLAVKALPWYTTVRVKAEDPAYAEWFLAFNCSDAGPTTGCHVPVCDNNYSPPLCQCFKTCGMNVSVSRRVSRLTVQAET